MDSVYRNSNVTNRRVLDTLEQKESEEKKGGKQKEQKRYRSRFGFPVPSPFFFSLLMKHRAFLLVILYSGVFKNHIYFTVVKVNLMLNKGTERYQLSNTSVFPSPPLLLLPNLLYMYKQGAQEVPI